MCKQTVEHKFQAAELFTFPTLYNTLSDLLCMHSIRIFLGTYKRSKYSDVNYED
jgi:hypothetical protein